MTSWSNNWLAGRQFSFRPRVYLMRLFCIVMVVARLLLPLTACAHVPLPESVTNPQTLPEAWNVLRLATANIEQLLRENRLSEVPDQASLCNPALRTLSRLTEPAALQKEVAARVVRASAAVNSLAQNCIAGDQPSIAVALGKLHTALGLLAEGVDPKILNADIYFCSMHPEMLSADAAALCPKCGMSLVPRRIPYSFIYVAPPGEPSMRMTASTDGLLKASQHAVVHVRLTKRDGTPVLLSDLLVAHTQPIHLLIIDPALDDYHHEHPTATNVPGEYEFAFTPMKNSNYRVFADVVPAATGVQEYVEADLPGAVASGEVEQVQDKESTFSATAGGLQFRLAFEAASTSPSRAGQSRALQIVVTDQESRPAQTLEPVMNAYAHLVGFYDDGHTVVHLHPAGAEIVGTAALGGPTLDFKFYPPKPGFMRLYCQVQVGGEIVFAPFNLNIIP